MTPCSSLNERLSQIHTLTMANRGRHATLHSHRKKSCPLNPRKRTLIDRCRDGALHLAYPTTRLHCTSGGFQSCRAGVIIFCQTAELSFRRPEASSPNGANDARNPAPCCPDVLSYRLCHRICR